MTEAECAGRVTAESREKWKEREKGLIDELGDAKRGYFADAARASRLQRRIGYTTLVCGVLTPVFVASSTGASETLLSWIPGNLLSILAILLSIILSGAEGLRRMLRPDDRWAACWLSAEALKSAREQYRDKKVGLCVGSEAWIANYMALRTAYETIIASETRQFFESIKPKGS